MSSHTQRPLVIACLFATPLAALLGLSFLSLFVFGEFTPHEELVRIYEARVPVVIGKEYVPDRSELKDEIIDRHAMDVVVLGNSRAFQMRQEFFKEPGAFFNYAQTGNVNDLADYLARIDKHHIAKPKAIIVILDHFFLLDGPSYHTTREGVGAIDWLVTVQSSIKDILSGSVTPIALLRALEDAPYIGTRAHVLHSGFRSDGSYTYGDIISDWRDPAHEDYAFSYSKRMLERGLNNFRHSDAPDPKVMESFASALSLANERGVHVVVLLPSFAPTMHNLIRREGEKYLYHSVGAEQLQAMTKRHGHGFYDFTNPETLELTDDDFFDGIHWGEAANARALLTIIETDEILNDLVDRSRIEAALKTSRNQPQYLFGVLYDNL